MYDCVCPSCPVQTLFNLHRCSTTGLKSKGGVSHAALTRAKYKWATWPRHCADCLYYPFTILIVVVSTTYTALLYKCGHFLRKSTFAALARLELLFLELLFLARSDSGALLEASHVLNGLVLCCFGMTNCSVNTSKFLLVFFGVRVFSTTLERQSRQAFFTPLFIYCS